MGERDLVDKDKLILRGLQFHGFHGVKPEEKKLGQKFVVDVDAWLDLSEAGKSDNLSDTVSYTEIYRIVRDVVEGPSQNLLESVAHLIANTTLLKFSQISAVRVKNVSWMPSKVIAHLEKEINDDSSYLYWAYKNGIPVFCPALTDGSLGDMLYCHSVQKPGLLIDIVQDIGAMNGEAVHASPRKTGIVVLGGGLPKHHICNANMLRNGADYAVYINTTQEFDGSDSGAQPDEAVSWGKIKGSAKTIKVHCDATIAFSSAGGCNLCAKVAGRD